MYRVKSIISEVPTRYLLGPLISLFVLFGLPMFVWQLELIGRSMQSDYREVKLTNTHWERYLSLLSKAPMAQLANTSDRVSLEVELREAALSLQIQSEVQIDVFTVASAESLEVDDELDSSIKPIRIGFEATLLHAPALLNILGRFEEVAGWRVAEVRGCAMQRLVSEPRIATACTIDIYHWSWTANTDTEVEKN